MIYKIEDVARDVRVCLDQNMASDDLLDEGDVDTLTLNDIIKSKIVEAVRRVHLSAPHHLLEQGHSLGAENEDGEPDIFWEEHESGYVALPDDFLRLVVFKMDDWERAVYETITPTDPKYILQSSRFKGIRGNTLNPVCVLAVRPQGRVLEFYSCKNTEAKVSESVYIPQPRIDEQGGIDISELCYEAVIYMAAALTITTFGDTEKAKLMSELSQTALQ